MTQTSQAHGKRSRAANATLIAMIGFTLSFGWMMILDIQFYGALPDNAIAVVFAVLVVGTIATALPRRWAPTVGAVVAIVGTIGAAGNPMTMTRLTDPETVAFGISNALILVFGALAAAAGIAATVQLRREGRSAQSTS